MRKKLAVALFMLLFFPACSDQAEPTPPATVASEATTAVEASGVTTQNRAQDEVTRGPSQAAVPPAATDLSTAQPTPPPHQLFEDEWTDRTVYRNGLLPAEQRILDELEGATVYHMSLQLDESLAQVNGRLENYYTNQESVPLREIYYHLFPNLLGGLITINNVRVNGIEISPILSGFNSSMMTLPLGFTLSPGEQIEITMDFETTVPTQPGRNYGMFAYVDDILALAHAYPMIAIYDDNGWNLDLPSEQGDLTYADVAFFLVRVTAPADQVVAAAGVAVQQETDGRTQSITFAAGPARDFYLVASDRYQVVSQQVGEITVNSYAPAEFAEAAALAAQYAATALSSFGQRFGPYPYRELDIVSTPTLALGIEYPGIVANTIRLYELDDAPFGIPNAVVLESTTVHEVGHQWFYGLVGNDQLEEPWLDESLTQYATYLYYVDTYGLEGAERYFASLENRWDRVERAEIPIGLPVASYNTAEYGAIVYGRGPIFIRELASFMGQETFDVFIHNYQASNRWGIVDGETFKKQAEVQCNCDLTDLFAEWVIVGQ